jgi:glyoxylase-like metal-dependent hydrolase (beta-lactamase superfamily II)
MASAPAVLLSPRVYRIPTAGDFVNSFAFLEADGSVTLVDCGLKRAPAAIVKGLAHIGRRPQDVQRIVLTHAHNDHAGGAAKMVADTGVDGVLIHEADADYARNGTAPPLDASLRSGRMFARLPYGGFAPVPVAGELKDGDLLDVAGGLQIFHTPGHTPGHVSLLHTATGVLITGDALFNIRSKIGWPMGAFCTSAAQNKQSAQILSQLDFELAAFTHGPEVRDKPHDAITAFLRSGK